MTYNGEIKADIFRSGFYVTNQENIHFYNLNIVKGDVIEKPGGWKVGTIKSLEIMQEVPISQ